MTSSSPQPAKPELLAPAGSSGCLHAALDAGCNAVYFGVGDLNMRATADNFSVTDVGDVCGLCHDRGVKAYLTLNTIVYTGELENCRGIVKAAAPFVDAVICWDPAVIQLCREFGIAVHISTQASVSNASSARFYRDLGAERIVLARECTLEDIVKIRADAGIEVEVFAHGAMCVSVSGRCFLSQFTYGKSGNRGECWQNCRREYAVYADDGVSEFRLGTDYVMSAKDLCSLPFLDQLLDAGVDALKIEGRNRPPEYVATVTGAYRRGIDAWCEGRLSPELREDLVAECQTVFNRDFSSGFFLGRPITEMTDQSGSKATIQKHHVGSVTNYYKKAHIAEIQVQNHGFNVGDKLLVTGPTSGAVTFSVTQIRQDDIDTETAERGIVTLPLDQRVRTNDLVYLLEKRNVDTE